MWRSYLFILLLFTSGFYEPLAEQIPFFWVIGLLVLVGVLGALLIDARIRERGSARGQH